MRYLSVAAVAGVLAGLGLLSLHPAAAAEKKADGWGTVKGQITLKGDVPTPEPIDVTADQQHCLSNGKLFKDKWVVDAKSKGIKNVVVWLVANPDLKGEPIELPVHPDLAKFPEKVVVDQPCCMFEPHVLGIRKEQTLVVKNGAPIPHNVNYSGKGKDGVIENNVLVPPGKEVEMKGFIPATAPVSISCSIHGWMKGYVRVFNDPYFAVTDKDGHYEIPKAPAGDYYLVVWHEEGGWHDVTEAKTDSGKTVRLYGQKVAIKPDGTTTVDLTYSAIPTK
jgi:hypothetical protein